MSGEIKVKITYEEFQEMIRYTIETTNQECLDPDYVELYTEVACEILGVKDDFDMQIITLSDDPESIVGVIVIFNPDTIPSVNDRLTIFNILKKKSYPVTPLKQQPDWQS